MVEFTRLLLPRTLDPTLITWTPGKRPPSPFCALCGSSIGEDDAELLVWKEDGAGARFCIGCVARHWGMHAEPDELPVTAGYAPIQPGVDERRLVHWEYPGHCPDCGAGDLALGPRGGLAVNRRCTKCGQWWNTVWHKRTNLGLIERIHPEPMEDNA